ncbi:MAG: adenylate/guanylate cyclase domain-containing protein [Acidimicrobiia bacterium]
MVWRPDAPEAVTEAVRPVTLLVSDLKGSTALAERLDPETLRSVLNRYFAEMRLVLESHGGTVVKIIGDAIVTVFAADDDTSGAADAADAARRATRAAIDTQVALEWLNDRFDATWAVRLVNRTGVASGDLTIKADLLAGDVVGQAEALESNAPPLETLIDAATRRLAGESVTVEAVGSVTGKSGEHTLEAWRLLAVDRGDVDRDVTANSGEISCTACGTNNERLARRCAQCGAALPLGTAAQEDRRTVTVLFADPKPLSLSGRRLSPEESQALMARYFETVRPVLVHHGGTVEKFIGDALMAVFGLPVRHEDDALRSVRAAVEMQARIHALNDEIESSDGVRFANPTGITTGSVVAGDATAGQRLVTGDVVNVAARFEQTAGVGEIIIGDLTRRLSGPTVEVEALEPLTLKGKTEAVPAFRVVGVHSTNDSETRHHLPLVGRDDELSALARHFERAVKSGQAARLTILGNPGVGKSRLVREFVDDTASSARVLAGNCLAYGIGITFWPLLRAVQSAAGITETDDADVARSKLSSMLVDIDDEGGDSSEVAARLESLVGLNDMPYPVTELTWALRRFFVHLTREHPLVLFVDDLHWAEQTLIDTIEELVRTTRAPVLFVCSARPTVLDTYREFVESSESISLEPLTDAHCEQFLRLLLDGSSVDQAAVRRIVDAAGGNPLFLEQLLSVFIDDGRLTCVDGHWKVSGDLDGFEIPHTVEALIAARLDRLTRGERTVIEPASVVGRRFAEAAIEYLVDSREAGALDDDLRRLADRELIIEDGGTEPAYLFEHQLIRDATYNGLLKETRAVLHERFVQWGEAINEARDRATEFEEIQGYHLEQAHRYWRELGPLDEHAVQVGVRGAAKLRSAGERALARGDMPAAASLLERSGSLLPDDHPDRSRTFLLAGNALHEIGAFDRAIAAYELSTEVAERAGRVAAAASASISRLRLQYLIGRVDDSALVTATVDETIAGLDAFTEPDHDALSRAWQLRLNVAIAGCRWAEAQRAAEVVIDHARLAGNGVLEIHTLPLLAFLAQKGPMPASQAMVACREILARVAFDRRSSALTQLELALLTAMDLDLEEARRLCSNTRDVLTELGWEMQAALVSLSSGPIELLAGDAVRAEAELRRDFDALHALNERNFISLTAALLADAVYRQQRFDEAGELVGFSRDTAAPDDIAVQIIVRSVEAKIIARRGRHDDALAMAAEAVTMIDDTDDPSGQADARLDLAEVRWLAGAVDGRGDGAVTTVHDAFRRYSRKGNRLGMQRAAAIAEAMVAGTDPLEG